MGQEQEQESQIECLQVEVRECEGRLRRGHLRESAVSLTESGSIAVSFFRAMVCSPNGIVLVVLHDFVVTQFCCTRHTGLCPLFYVLGICLLVIVVVLEHNALFVLLECHNFNE